MIQLTFQISFYLDTLLESNDGISIEWILIYDVKELSRYKKHLLILLKLYYFLFFVQRKNLKMTLCGKFQQTSLMLLYKLVALPLHMQWFLQDNLSLIDLLTPYQPPKYVKVHTGENKIDRQSQMWRQCTCYFPADGSTNPDVFQPKTFPIPRGIIPQNFSSLGFTVLEELGNKQTHSLTDRLVL